MDNDELAEKIHNDSDGCDMVSIIESYLDLLEEHDPEGYQEYVEDYDDEEE